MGSIFTRIIYTGGSRRVLHRVPAFTGGECQSPFALLREFIGDARLNYFNKIIISEILTEVKF